jgi:hypothetical protein
LNNANILYSFLGKALLTEAALDRTQRRRRRENVILDAEMERRLSLNLLDPESVASARRMAAVYTAIAAFENSARDLVSKTLQEKNGDNWWQASESEKIRKKAQQRQEEEAKVRWHTQRGRQSIDYTDFGDLMGIVFQKWAAFGELLLDQAWVTHIFDTLERSRNLIMHSGELEDEDMARIGVVIRDWIKQVPV